MEQMSYSAFRQQLASVMDRVAADHKPVMITRGNGAAGVFMSLEDFESYEETAYLLANPYNAIRLHQSVLEAEAGNLEQHALLDTEE
jgi:antitoxin YefM